MTEEGAVAKPGTGEPMVERADGIVVPASSIPAKVVEGIFLVQQFKKDCTRLPYAYFGTLRVAHDWRERLHWAVLPRIDLTD